MIAEKAVKEYTKQFEQSRVKGNGQLGDLRAEAISKFNLLGFPTSKEEEWRYTDISPLLRIPYTVAGSDIIASLKRADLKVFDVLDSDSPQIVFINGVYAPYLSMKIDNLPFTIHALSSGNSTVKIVESLKNSPAVKSDGFTAMNSAFFSDSVLIDVSDNVTVDEPIQVLFISTQAEHPQVVFPRLFVRLGRNSTLTLIESYLTTKGTDYFVNAVSDVYLGENASMQHIRLQQEAKEAYHIGHSFVIQKAHSRYRSYSFSFGSRISRHQIETVLDGPGAEAVLNGLYLGKENQLLDNHTLIDHKSSHCQSHELYRGVLADEARGVFSGKILVRRDAQKTDAIQNNNGLLLSEKAHIDSKPQLEIYADDVRCTHGATVGQLDEESLFYLRSRGIGQKTAKDILIYAFAEEVLKGIAPRQLREHFDRILNKYFEKVTV
ncbi:MAG TPA: Fe-S cluster assembly protein SufD [Calditrichaeota bacterium]|nr:Fe-S cluster assembly protein SufD [Calditrichota bacterium]